MIPRILSSCLLYAKSSGGEAGSKQAINNGVRIVSWGSFQSLAASVLVVPIFVDSIGGNQGSKIDVFWLSCTGNRRQPQFCDSCPPDIRESGNNLRRSV